MEIEIKNGIFSASISLDEGEALDLPDLVELHGSLLIERGASVAMPKLKRIVGDNGHLYFGGSANLPELETVSGKVAVWDDVTLILPKLTSVGSVIVGDRSKLEAPLLSAAH